MRKVHTRSALLRPALAAAALALLATGALAQAPKPVPLAPNIQKAPQLDPPKAAYVVVNETPLYKVPSYDPDKTTGETLKRGQRPQVLGEASSGLWILVGKSGTGVGYASRSLLCPVNLCSDIKG